MRRLRTKITAILLFVVCCGIFGTLLVTTRTYVADRRDYVTEVNSIAAPNVAAAIGKRLDYLQEELLVFSKLPGVDRLELYDGARLVEARGTPAGDCKAAPGPLASLRSGGERVLVPACGKLLFGARVGTGAHRLLALAWLRPEQFNENFELARALSVALVGEDGSIGLGSGMSGRTRLPYSASSELTHALRTRDRQAVISRELSLEGERMLAAIAPVPATQGVAVVVLAPAAQVSSMVRQALRDALPFIAVVLLITMGMGMLFSAQLVRPLEDLTEATTSIARGQWRVSIRTRARDEVGKLVRAFSRMGQELETREEALKKANEELVRSERLAALGRFSAGIAHEVKNPLNSILGYAQVIQRKPEADSSGKFLGFIMDEARRANKIISDLLTFARQKPPALARVRVNELLERAFELTQPQAAAARVSVEKMLGAPELEAELDRDQMYQVLLNLITNAIHALEEKPEGERRLALRLRAEPGQAIIEIADSGPGIPPENLPKIFEPFFSTKGVGKGSGLGLSLCLGIVELHRGRITVDSKVGQGTTFTIRLPR